ncbi:MAG: undecaprenyl-phosphate glucose phosphotransferase [Anaerolineae bacterium]
MKHRVNLLFTASLVLVDALMVSLAFYLAYQLRLLIKFPPPVNVQPFSSYVGMMVIQVLTMLTVFFFSRLYHVKRGLSRLDEFYSILAATSVGTVMAIAFTSFTFKNSLLEVDYSRAMIIYAWLLTIVLVALGRLLHHRLVSALHARGIGETRVLIVGTGEIGRIIGRRILRSPALGYQVIGFVDDNAGRDRFLGLPILGKTAELTSLVDAHQVDEVIIALPEASHEEILALISRCRREKVSIKVFPDVFQIMASEISIADLDGLPLLTVRDIALRGWRLTLKRAVDLIISSLVLILASPLMLLIALLIKLDSPGPVFYTQERMGLDEKLFKMLKFRSMKVGAEDETGPVWATKDDPRRTRVGAFLRRFSLDELPQFINVLLGEMSIVGPRPERPVFVEQFKKSIPRYMDRHREKAGITGWAQVNGLRGDTSIMERTKYDLYYIENWSLWFDFKIMLKTLVGLFHDNNAY